MSRTVNVHLFVSSKGGVGKSALAVAAAAAAGARGGRAVVLDADFTGTSLSDGLDLRAPDLEEGSGGRLLLRSPRRGWMTVEASRAARARRDAAGRAPFALPYLNDAILHHADGIDTECDVPTMAWRWDALPEVAFLPSSPLQRDVEVALDWLQRAPAERTPWELRVRSVLLVLLLQDEGVTDVMVDLAPGLFGLTAAVLRAAEGMSGGGVDVRVVPVLVLTEDRHDLRLSAPAFVRLLDRFPRARAVFNRVTQPLPRLQRQLVASLGDRADEVPEPRWPRHVDVRDDLGRLFRDEADGLSRATCDVIADALGWGGADGP
ncbi:MAG TPA: P-loop NTPase [Myxococcota bacterium]|nr:P-loop NTPase [Myxococcota bacterium]